MNTQTITIIGKDRRTDFVFEKLKASGFDTYQITSNKELDEAETLSTVLLPLPYCSVESMIKGTDIHPSDLLSHLDNASRVILGKADDFIVNASKAVGFSFIDLNEDLLFKRANAIPTAEAALRIAMESSDATLFGKNIAVLGFGCIAKRLVGILCGFSVNVTVFARNSADRILAAMCGCEAYPFSSLSDIASKQDIIFNTCPAPVISSDVIDTLKPDCTVIDLASRPGGCDFVHAEQKHINAKLCLGLPDKYYPVTSGKDYLEAVLRALGAIIF